MTADNDELCGYEGTGIFSGYFYCRDHPTGDDPTPIYAVEVDDEHCNVCGIMLAWFAVEQGLR